MKKLIIWYNPNKNIYYWKYVYNLFNKYYVGYTNQYNHKILLIIDIYKDIYYKVPFRKKVIRKLISFLHRLEKKL